MMWNEGMTLGAIAQEMHANLTPQYPPVVMAARPWADKGDEDPADSKEADAIEHRRLLLQVPGMSEYKACAVDEGYARQARKKALLWAKARAADAEARSKV